MDDRTLTYIYTIEVTAELTEVLQILRILWRAIAGKVGPGYNTYMGVKVMDILDFLIQAVNEEIEKERTNGENITDPGSGI